MKVTHLAILLIQTHLSKIHIWEPKQLKSHYQDIDIPYTIMNFGNVPYGHTVYGTVF